MLLHMIEVLRINDSNFDFPHLLLQSKNYAKPLQPNPIQACKEIKGQTSNAVGAKPMLRKS